jgi:hypothetical protein
MNGQCHYQKFSYITIFLKSNDVTESRDIYIICEISYQIHTHNHVIVSKWLLFNANSVIFQLYHGENKLIFNEMMMRPALY